MTPNWIIGDRAKRNEYIYWPQNLHTNVNSSIIHDGQKRGNSSNVH